MSTIGCNEFIGQLEDWLDGNRHPDARAHAKECPDCRSVAADLQDIRGVAPALMVADPEPSPELWIRLRSQLEQEGIIRNGGSIPSGARMPAWLDRLLVAIPRPALAGAYLAFLFAVAFGFSTTQGLRTSQSPNFALSGQLDSAEQTAYSSMGDGKSLASASLHENLAIVDNYIVLCEKSVREEPNSEAARDYLYQAYQQKAELIDQMTERGEPSR
jgi:hypothetical protein